MGLSEATLNAARGKGFRSRYKNPQYIEGGGQEPPVYYRDPCPYDLVGTRYMPPICNILLLREMHKQNTSLGTGGEELYIPSVKNPIPFPYAMIDRYLLIALHRSVMSQTREQ